jgi:hypothetical protein
VIGHDCGHRSFSKNKLVEDIVGTLMFMVRGLGLGRLVTVCSSSRALAKFAPVCLLLVPCTAAAADIRLTQSPARC